MYLSSPGDLYLYVSLGDTFNSNWAVEDPSSNIQSTSIAQVSGTWYVFVHASYSAVGTYNDSFEVRISYTPPGTLRHYGWDTIVGTSSYTGPIWKDYIYTVPFQSSRIQYRVRNNGNDIYKGWCYETGQDLEICVNDVARDYLYTTFPSASNVWYQDYSASRNFELYIGLSEDSDPDTKAADITFTYDWSYDDSWTSTPSEAWLAMEPLQYTLDSRAYHIFSVNTKATLTDTHSISYINNNNSRSLLKTQLAPGTYYLYSNNGNYSRTFHVQNNCGIRYCLYYVNSRGGWDSVLVDGVSMQTDKYDRETYTQNYRTPSINRGVIEYRNNITESWTLYLKSLGDARNPIFHNLYESTNVYLHDLEEGRIIPVVITSREMQYKTRKNQGKKMYTYEITVESSQRKLRM